MTSDRRFFSGDSLAQALNQAAQYFQLAPAEISYKLVEKRHGFLKVRRKVVIEVDGADPGRTPPEATGASPAAERAASPAAAGVTPPAATPSPAGTPPLAAMPSPAGTPPSAATPSPAGTPPPAATPPPAGTPPPAATRSPSSAPADGSAPAGSSDRRRRPRPETTAEPTRVSPREPGTPADVELTAEEAPGSPEDAPDDGRVELPAARQPAKTRFRGARGEEAEAARDALARILELAGLELESEILQGDEELLVELWGSDQDILLRDRGRLLLAIQHLMPRVIRGLLGRSVACRVDSDDFHMIREERLRDLAQRAADDVRHRGRPKTLEPMSPDERRIVHLTLADYPGVETESHGSGLFKRVMVRVSRGEKPRGEGW